MSVNSNTYTYVSLDMFEAQVLKFRVLIKQVI